MTLEKRIIPPVTREFALKLKEVFRPYTVEPGFDRDELMQSVGEQRVISWILHHSNNTVIKSNVDIDNTLEKNPIDNNNEDKSSWITRFTNRFGL